MCCLIGGGNICGALTGTGVGGGILTTTVGGTGLLSPRSEANFECGVKVDVFLEAGSGSFVAAVAVLLFAWARTRR